MPETDQPARRPDYRILTHAISILTYVISALLAGAAVWFLALMLDSPDNAVWRTLFATFACMSLIGTIGTTLHRKVDLDAARNRRETAELRKDIAAMMYEVMRAVALAEMGIGVGRDLTGLVDRLIVRDMADEQSAPGNVVHLPPGPTREALENIRRKINGDNSGD
jgi:hypothetical protein